MKKYMTTAQAAEKWGYPHSTHIARLCKNGVIKGAKRSGDGYNAKWLIPVDAPKPPDRRLHEYKQPLKSDAGYMTIEQACEKWGRDSAKAIARICAEGRIEGAIKKRSIWMIPEDAENPEDPRREVPVGYMSVDDAVKLSGIDREHIEFLCKYGFIEDVIVKCEQYMLPEQSIVFLTSSFANMRYQTVEETAENWKCSKDNVTYFLRKGRIPDAVKKGKFWFIPKDTKKPK